MSRDITVSREGLILTGGCVGVAFIAVLWLGLSGRFCPKASVVKETKAATPVAKKIDPLTGIEAEPEAPEVTASAPVLQPTDDLQANLFEITQAMGFDRRNEAIPETTVSKKRLPAIPKEKIEAVVQEQFGLRVVRIKDGDFMLIDEYDRPATGTVISVKPDSFRVVQFVDGQFDGIVLYHDRRVTKTAHWKNGIWNGVNQTIYRDMPVIEEHEFRDGMSVSARRIEIQN